MEKKPLVSVIMGVYNCSNTLEEAVKCITNQTYSNLELIICDDASTDNTYEVALKIAQQDERVVLIRNNENLTLAPTLNKCLEIANGEYIARMDGDDVCAGDRIEKEMAVLLGSDKYSFVSCWMELFDENGVFGTIKHVPEPKALDLISRSQFVHAACIIRKMDIMSINGYSTSKNRRRVEDYDLWVRLYKNGCVGYNIQEVLYSMRDDRYANKRRTLNNRLNESSVKRMAIKDFKAPFYMYIYTIIPIIKFFLPNVIYKIVHARK